MTVLNTIRFSIFCTSIVFSLIVLGILANFTSITTADGFYYHSFALGIAVSIMTLLAVSASLIIDRLRSGAITSVIFVELAWTGLLWVLWIATAASISSLRIFTSCGFFNATVESNCRQYQAVQAFAYLTWLFLLGWFSTLLILSIISASKGDNNVWKASSTEYPFFAEFPSEKGLVGTSTYSSPAPQYNPGPQYGNQSYPSQPYQQPYPPVQGQQPYTPPPAGQQAYQYGQPQQSYGSPPPEQPYQYGQPQQQYGNTPQPYAPQQPYPQV